LEELPGNEDVRYLKAKLAGLRTLWCEIWALSSHTPSVLTESIEQKKKRVLQLQIADQNQNTCQPFFLLFRDFGIEYS